MCVFFGFSWHDGGSLTLLRSCAGEEGKTTGVSAASRGHRCCTHMHGSTVAQQIGVLGTREPRRMEKGKPESRPAAASAAQSASLPRLEASVRSNEALCRAAHPHRLEKRREHHRLETIRWGLRKHVEGLHRPAWPRTHVSRTALRSPIATLCFRRVNGGTVPTQRSSRETKGEACIDKDSAAHLTTVVWARLRHLEDLRAGLGTSVSEFLAHAPDETSTRKLLAHSSCNETASVTTNRQMRCHSVPLAIRLPHPIIC